MSAVRYSAAAKAEALQQVHELQNQGYSRRGAVHSVAERLGCRLETLNAWLRRETNQKRMMRGVDHDKRIQQLEREVLQLLRANAALRQELDQRIRRQLPSVAQIGERR